MFEYGHVAYQKLRNEKSFLWMCLFFLYVEQFLRYPTKCDLKTCPGVTPLQAVFAVSSPVSFGDMELFVLELITELRQTFIKQVFFDSCMGHPKNYVLNVVCG